MSASQDNSDEASELEMAQISQHFSESADKNLLEEQKEQNFLSRLRYEWEKRRGESSERVAWYVNDWANSVYASTSISLFIPIFLSGIAEQLSNSKSIATCDPSCDSAPCILGKEPCKTCVIGKGMVYWNGTSFTRLPAPQQSVHFLGEVDSFTFPTRVLSFSVIAQCLFFITFGALADYGKNRKLGLILCTAIGSLSCMLFLFVTDPHLYPLAAWLTIISNICFGLSVVYYNAFLPILVSFHPEVTSMSNSMEKIDEIENFMSTVGFMFGYIAGFLGAVFGVVLQAVVGNEDNNRLGDRVTIFFAGLWWGGWSLWTFYYLGAHPGKRRPKLSEFVTVGWASTFSTIRHAASYPETMKFFIAYFFYSDAYTTVSSVGVLVMQQKLCMSSTALGVVILEVLLLASFGNLLLLKIQWRFKLESKVIICIALAGYLFLCLVGIIGLIPSSPVGLKQRAEAFLFGAVHGLMIGPVQSFSRTMFADLTVPGKEAEFFALFEITDKGSSWLGPLVVGEIYRRTSTINLGFVYLSFMILLPACVLLSVNHRKGMIDVGRILH